MADHEIAPRSFAGMPATMFRAGPELSFQLLAIWLLSWVVGPEIPTLAAELLSDMIRRNIIRPGATHAGSLLTLDQFEPLFAGLAVRHEIVEESYQPLFRRVMGNEFDLLATPVRQMHDLTGDGGASGVATVTRGRSGIARLVCDVMRLPPTGESKLHVSFAEDRGVERWTRDFNGNEFSSELSQSGTWLVERFGPMRFSFELAARDAGLEMLPRGWSIFRLRLPLTLAPNISTRTWADGWFYCFNVEVALPVIGQMIRYAGRIRYVACVDGSS